MARTRPDEFCVPQDAVHGPFTDGQFEHVHQAPGTETGRIFPRRDDEFFMRCLGPARLVMRPAGMIGERVVAGLPPTKP